MLSNALVESIGGRVSSKCWKKNMIFSPIVITPARLGVGMGEINLKKCFGYKSYRVWRCVLSVFCHLKPRSGFRAVVTHFFFFFFQHTYLHFSFAVDRLGSYLQFKYTYTTHGQYSIIIIIYERTIIEIKIVITSATHTRARPINYTLYVENNNIVIQYDAFVMAIFHARRLFGPRRKRTTILYGTET